MRHRDDQRLRDSFFLRMRPSFLCLGMKFGGKEWNKKDVLFGNRLYSFRWSSGLNCYRYILDCSMETPFSLQLSPHLNFHTRLPCFFFKALVNESIHKASICIKTYSLARLYHSFVIFDSSFSLSSRSTKESHGCDQKRTKKNKQKKTNKQTWSQHDTLRLRIKTLMHNHSWASTNYRSLWRR